MMRRIFHCSGTALAAIGVSACSLAEPPGGADPTDAEQVSLGRTVYDAHCAVCHGPQLEGQPDWRQRLHNGRLPAPPHDETGHTWHHPDQQLFGMTKYGMTPYAPEGYESDMPAFDSTLFDEEIWAVLAYIKSTWPEGIRQRQTAISERSD
jgi:mono/diheme cytochrome c family protein